MSQAGEVVKGSWGGRGGHKGTPLLATLQIIVFEKEAMYSAQCGRGGGGADAI